jgi:hypothetical protein
MIVHQGYPIFACTDVLLHSSSAIEVETDQWCPSLISIPSFTFAFAKASTRERCWHLKVQM